MGAGSCTGNFLWIYEKQEVGASPRETHLSSAKWYLLTEVGPRASQRLGRQMPSLGVLAGVEYLPVGSLKFSQAALSGG